MQAFGVDEVGRGSWAGPLVVAAVKLNVPIDGLRDSKKIPANKRMGIALEICKLAEAIGIGWVKVSEVDSLGLTKALILGSERALKQAGHDNEPVIIDGNHNFLAHLPNTEAVIKADDKFPEVSAASIVAKVARDNYMKAIARMYPQYQFDSHVGYGTPVHATLLQKHGICDLHRRSFKPIQALIT